MTDGENGSGIYMYRGKNIENFSRVELLVILKKVIDELQGRRQRFNEIRDIVPGKFPSSLVQQNPNSR